MDSVYEVVYRALLRHLPAEAAHRAGFWLIRTAGALPAVNWLLRRWLAPRDPVLRVQALGLDLPGPLGLAAGFDKDARGVAALAALGFAFIEVGTVTAQAQPGNPRPRMFRLPADRAVVNRMGFNNAGAAAAAERLRARQLQAATRPGPRARRGGDGRRGGARGSGRRALDRVVVGVNIGKTKAVPADEAIADYVTSARLVAGVADYVVVNVSSPNTPGLRDLQAVSSLRPLLTAVRAALDGQGRPRREPRGPEAANGETAAAGRRVPLLVKIAPDLADDDVDAIADLAVELGLDGIIATNTTIARPDLVSDPALVTAAGAGGLSGVPLRPRALEVLRRLHARAGDRLVLIAAGGIETADDAWERIAAGATLVQAYTGFIYGGPRWPRRIQDGLARRARAAGLKSVSEARGTMVAPLPRYPADDGIPPSAVPSQAEPAQTEAAQAEPARTGDTETGDARAEAAQPGDAQAGDAQAGDAQAGVSRAEPAQAGDAQPGDAQPGDAQPGDAQPGDAQPGDAQPGDAQAGDAQPGDAQPGDAQPGDAQPGDAQPGDAQPGDAQAGDAQAELAEAGAAPSELSEAEPGDRPEPVPGQPPPNLAGS
jgi:dihydroorotate dehydrogenase